MESTLAYALDVAPADVAAVMQWLQGNSFEVVRANGGSGESFGNVALAFSDQLCKVHIMRDRGIWECAVGLEGGDYQNLGLVLAVMEGRVIDAETVKWMSGALRWPTQLPEHTSWAEVLPRIFDWFRGGDRTTDLDRGHDDWRAAALPRAQS